MKVYIIRHGETDANQKGLLQGWTNFPLNSLGERLAVETGNALKDIHFDLAFSSPLLRADRTTKLVLENSENTDTPVIYDERLKEIAFGTYENCKISDVIGKDKNLQLFFKNPLDGYVAPSNGESIEEVCMRTQDFLNTLLLHREENILVSTHGCALRAMLNRLYHESNDFWQGHVPYNCSISIVEIKDGKMALLEFDKVLYDHNKIIDHYKNC